MTQHNITEDLASFSDAILSSLIHAVFSVLIVSEVSFLSVEWHIDLVVLVFWNFVQYRSSLILTMCPHFIVHWSGLYFYVIYFINSVSKPVIQVSCFPFTVQHSHPPKSASTARVLWIFILTYFWTVVFKVVLMSTMYFEIVVSYKVRVILYWIWSK